MRSLLQAVWFAAALCVFGAPGAAQTTPGPAPDAEPQSRVAQIEQDRLEKSRNLEPERPSELEQRVERILSGGLLSAPSGWGVKLGGMISGAGFGLGPRYFRPDLWDEQMQLDFSAVGSLKQYYSLETSVAFPRIAGKRFDAVFSARRNDYPSIQYFGPGPRSSRDGKTNYRREDNLLQTRLGWRPDRRHLLVGVEGGLLRLNVGPGIGKLSPSSDTLYSPLQAPGIDHQTRLGIVGPFALFDYRDSPGDPHRGGAYSARYLDHSDRTLRQFSFRRLDIQGEHYFPFLNENRVFALFARTQLSYANSDQQVPFYMQPVMGGANNLRGLTQFRYYDNNALYFTGEYRWEVFPGVDMALFADAGNVFPRPGLIGFRNMQGGGGIGLRVKTRQAMVLRIDAGVSREGFRLWITPASVFSR
jgi:outer membrane protein assembly factor BamA